MATIQARKNKTGTSYTATVRTKGHKPVCATFPTKKEAADWAGDIEAAIRARRHKDPRLTEIPFSEAMEKYLTTISAAKATTTHQRERVSARALLAGLGGETYLGEITPRLLAAYRDRRMREVGAYSVRLEMALLSHLFRVARREWEIPVENPVNDVDRPKPPSGRVVFLDLEQAQRLLVECRAAKNKMLYPYVLLLLQSAMRPSEAAAIRCGQIDLERRSLTLIDTKNGDRRPVPLTAATIDALTPLIAGKPPESLVFIPHLRPSYIAVPSLAFRESFSAARARANLKHLHLHDLRHTAASWMIMRRVDLRTLAAVLGHRTLQMVMRYTHLDDEHQRAALDTIGDLGMPTPEVVRDPE